MIGSLIKTPFQLAGRAGRAIEMAFPNVFHPEQILSKSPNLRRLYDFTVKEARMSRLLAEHFKRETDDIIKTYGLKDEEKGRQFLELLEFPYFNKRFPTGSELSSYPREIQLAVRDHLKRVSDPIYKMAKANDPDVGYIPGYFTHFPVRWQKQTILDEIKRLNKVKSTSTDPTLTQKLEEDLAQLNKRLTGISHVDETMKALRYQQLPTGGRFGPLDEAREAKGLLQYKMDYKDVMDEYIEGAMRKVFLDRYMPTAKLFFEKTISDPKKKVTIANPFYEANDALRQYAFDFVTAQRGALSSRRKIFLNESLAQLFPDPESGYRNVAKAVDYATRFQYLSKIGLSWFRFPLVNATQTLLTTYPLVGGKLYMKGMMDAVSNPAIWKEAKDVGVVFEATLRKGVTEMLGRHTKLTAVERGLSWPAKFSEQFNRVMTYAAGKKQAVELGLTGEKAVNHAINLVNRTQFLYHKEALPLVVSTSPAGRLLFQFRTFTANYVNYMTSLVREKRWPEFGRALGSLAVLSGSSAIPFNLWHHTRVALLKRGVVDIGEFNPVEYGTEMLGISPPVNLGQSLEPFNIPGDLSQVFGPTIGPILKFGFEFARKPEEAEESFKRFLDGISPPVTALVRGISPEVKTEPTVTFPRGRMIGKRSTVEQMFLRPSTEASRNKYITLIAAALAGGMEAEASKLIKKAQSVGVTLDSVDMAQIRRRATMMKGRKEE